MKENKENKNVLLVDLNNLWVKTLYVTDYDLKDHLSFIINYIRKIYKSRQYSKIILVVDGSCKSGKSCLPSYKASRAKKKEIYDCLDLFISIVNKYVKVVKNKDVEGDFVTAQLAFFYKNKGFDVTIFSNDKDFLQLAQYGIKVAPSVKDGKVECLADEEILAKFKNSKKEPLDKIENVLKYRVFKGDQSDEIPSAVPRLKDKDIREIINLWEGNTLDEEGLEKLIEKVEDKKVRERLIECKDNILRNYKLMNLNTGDEDILKNLKVLKYATNTNGAVEWGLSQWQIYW